MNSFSLRLNTEHVLYFKQEMTGKNGGRRGVYKGTKLLILYCLYVVGNASQGVIVVDITR